MKKIILLTLALLITVSSFAQKDPKAKVILDKVSAAYKKRKSMQGNLVLTIVNTKDNINEKQSGKFFVKGSKFRVEMGEQNLICNGTTLWTHLVDVKEVQISEYDPSETETLTPSNIYTMWEKGFKYKLAADKVIAGKTYNVVELFPEDVSKDFFKIELYINKTNSNIEIAKIFDKNGNRYQYTLTNIVTDKDIADAMFSFDKSKFPGVDVTDLR